MSGSLWKEPAEDDVGIWRIGTSGWSYPPSTGRGRWTGVFYPWSRIDELKFYARFLTAVEVNSTFYRPCSSEAAAKWIRRTPSHFEFTVKVWRRFTHERGGWSSNNIDRFRSGIHPLAEHGKLGALLFQFPSIFHSNPAAIDYLASLLGRFEAYPNVVELRHRSWASVQELLMEMGAIPAFIDAPTFPSSMRQELIPTGRMIYVRLHGRRGEKWWRHERPDERYDYLYTAEELDFYSSRLKTLATQSAIEKAYIFSNNHPGAKAIVNALMLRRLLGIPIDVEIPERLRSRFPELQTSATGC